MEKQVGRDKQQAVVLFTAIVALTGLGLGLSDSVLSNYFREAHNADAFARGLIELPRELPWVLVMFIVSSLAFLGDVRLAIAAQILSIIGILWLGLFSPTFNVMLIFLFINSLGMHMFMPLCDSMGMSLAKEGGVGTMMGRLNGMRTAFSMMAAILVFVGFRVGFFDFASPIIWNFVIAACLFAVVLILLFKIFPLMPKTNAEKSRFVLNWHYRKYYALAMIFGARKQVMYVYGPWVLIELLAFGADFIALLIIGGAGIGIFFIPAVGRWIDRHGPAKIMMIEAGIFMAIYLAYGIISAGLHSGRFVGAGAVLAIAVAINIADRTTMHFGMTRTIYMRSIAKSPEDVTPTLATGMALDHILTICSAILCGFLWRQFGPHFVFIFAGCLAVLCMLIANSIRKDTPNEPKEAQT